MLLSLGQTAFPRGSPGFGYSHPAALGCVFSMVNGATNLFGGGAPTVNGTPTSVVDGVIGSTTSFQTPDSTSTTSAGFTFTASGPASPTAITIAVILRNQTNASHNMVLVSDVPASGAGSSVVLGAGTSRMIMSVNTVNGGSSGFFLDNTVPSLLIGTYAGGLFKYIRVNLRNGKIASESHSVSNVNPNGSITAIRVGFGGASGGFAQAAWSSIACAMLSYNFLSDAVIQAWALDPWSFWYPPRQLSSALLYPLARRYSSRAFATVVG